MLQCSQMYSQLNILLSKQMNNWYQHNLKSMTFHYILLRKKHLNNQTRSQDHKKQNKISSQYQDLMYSIVQLIS